MKRKFKTIAKLIKKLKILLIKLEYIEEYLSFFYLNKILTDIFQI